MKFTYINSKVIYKKIAQVYIFRRGEKTNNMSNLTQNKYLPFGDNFPFTIISANRIHKFF